MELLKEVSNFWTALNNFELYKHDFYDHGLHSNYNYSWVIFGTLGYLLGLHYPLSALSVQKLSQNFFKTNWHITIYISVIYFAIIKGIQVSLRNKDAFELKIPLILWNGALSLFSIAGFLRFGEDLLFSLNNRPPYEWICYSCHPNDVAAFWSLLFAISKLLELGDTLFIVLRKKPLIFLHYYHHVAVLIYTFHAGAEHTAAGRAFITMNYLAHSVMYTITRPLLVGSKFPALAKCVTLVQTTQMLVGVLISCAVLWIKMETNWQCQQSKANLGLAFLIYTTFLVLFLQFYWTAYVRKGDRKQAPNKKNEKKIQ